MSLYTFVLASGAAATVDTNKTNELLVAESEIIVKAMAYAKTGPTGAALIFDINLNGTTIWDVGSQPGNQLQIAAGSVEATPITAFDVTTLSANDNLTIDIDQIGSTVAGQDITVILQTVKANTEFRYFGDPDVDGSWREGVVAGEFVTQRRVSGTYQTFQAVIES